MKKQKKAADNQPLQPDHNPGHQSDGADGPDETRQTRTRPAAPPDDGGSPMPSSAAEAVDSTPKHAPISDDTATAITSIVESACQTMQLPDEQRGELRQCLPVLLRPDSSLLDKGHSLLNIIEHQLMPAWDNVVEDSYKHFKLTQLEVRSWFPAVFSGMAGSLWA